MTKQKHSRATLRDKCAGVYNYMCGLITKVVNAADNRFPILATVRREKADNILYHKCSRRARAHLIENPQKIQYKAGLCAV